MKNWKSFNALSAKELLGERLTWIATLNLFMWMIGNTPAQFALENVSAWELSESTRWSIKMMPQNTVAQFARKSSLANFTSRNTRKLPTVMSKKPFVQSARSHWKANSISRCMSGRSMFQSRRFSIVKLAIQPLQRKQVLKDTQNSFTKSEQVSTTALIFIYKVTQVGGRTWDLCIFSHSCNALDLSATAPPLRHASISNHTVVRENPIKVSFDINYLWTSACKRNTFQI